MQSAHQHELRWGSQSLEAAQQIRQREEAAVLAQVPDLAPERLRYQPLLVGPLPLAWLDVPMRPVVDVEDAADALAVGVLARAVAPLVEAYADTFRLSRQVLWGNAASAVAGAVQMLGRTSLPVRLDPVALARAALSVEPLRGTGCYQSVAADTVAFRRRSCCLYYRVPGSGTCADRVLDTAGDSRR